MSLRLPRLMGSSQQSYIVGRKRSGSPPTLVGRSHGNRRAAGVAVVVAPSDREMCLEPVPGQAAKLRVRHLRCRISLARLYQFDPYREHRRLG
jgi:hypothetical protein